MKTSNERPSYEIAGLISLTLRLVVGWTYFSALWRRMVLDNKLNPDSIGYVGEKFNHFLPNALGIKPLIEYMVTHPEVLEVSMIVFTVAEGIVGLFLMLGFFTRAAAVGVFGLAMGILLGSGWLGTTCLDEWQIGVLGVAAGFTLFISGSGAFSIDNLVSGRHRHQKWFRWLASGPLPAKRLNVMVVTGSLAIFSLTLFTNQYFHGGLYGTLHNKSVKPKIEVSAVHLASDAISFEVFRVEGVDVYGSFLIGITISDAAGNEVYKLNGKDLSKLNAAAIHNFYIAKVKPGAHSLMIPLGARARLNLKLPDGLLMQGTEYTLTLTDISGIEWKTRLG